LLPIAETPLTQFHQRGPVKCGVNGLKKLGKV